MTEANNALKNTIWSSNLDSGKLRPSDVATVRRKHKFEVGSLFVTSVSMLNATIAARDLNVQIIGTKPQISNARKIMIWHSLRNYQHIVTKSTEVDIDAMSVELADCMLTMVYSIVKDVNTMFV